VFSYLDPTGKHSPKPAVLNDDLPHFELVRLHFAQAASLGRAEMTFLYGNRSRSFAQCRRGREIDATPTTMTAALRWWGEQVNHKRTRNRNFVPSRH
jgi:hypothetical protein